MMEENTTDFMNSNELQIFSGRSTKNEAVTISNKRIYINQNFDDEISETIIGINSIKYVELYHKKQKNSIAYLIFGILLAIVIIGIVLLIIYGSTKTESDLTIITNINEYEKIKFVMDNYKIEEIRAIQKEIFLAIDNM